MTELAAVSVPATSANIGPGFDAFGIALDLRLTAVAHARGDVRVRTTGEGADEVATGDDNLVWTSLLAACDRFGWAVPDVSLRVHNPIPLARGMGSSSAAIVAGLALARVLAGADASVHRPGPGSVGDVALTRLADELEGHPDNVAPAVHGGLVACAATDDGATVVRLAAPPATTRPVLLVPDTELLTTEARGMIPASLSRADVVVQAARAGHVIGAMVGAWPVDPGLAGDRLHEPVRGDALPAGATLLAELRGAGLHAWLSGAGPSLAVALPAADEAAVEDVTARAARHGHVARPLRWDRQGVRACATDGCGMAGMRGCSGCPLAPLQ